MKTKGQKTARAALMGLPEEIIAEQDRSLPMDQWMERKYPGSWVWDNSCDKFITLDRDHSGPGVGYLVLDRQRRSWTTVVLPHQVH